MDNSGGGWGEGGPNYRSENPSNWRAGEQDRPATHQDTIHEVEDSQRTRINSKRGRSNSIEELQWEEGGNPARRLRN